MNGLTQAIRHLSAQLLILSTITLLQLTRKLLTRHPFLSQFLSHKPSHTNQRHANNSINYNNRANKTPIFKENIANPYKSSSINPYQLGPELLLATKLTGP